MGDEAKQNAVKNTQTLGESGPASEESTMIVTLRDKVESPRISKTRKTCAGKPSLHGHLVGFMAEEETSDTFSDKFKVKTSTAIETKVRSKSTERVHLQGNTLAFEETKEVSHPI